MQRYCFFLIYANIFAKKCNKNALFYTHTPRHAPLPTYNTHAKPLSDPRNGQPFLPCGDPRPLGAPMGSPNVATAAIGRARPSGGAYRRHPRPACGRLALRLNPLTRPPLGMRPLRFCSLPLAAAGRAISAR